MRLPLVIRPFLLLTLLAAASSAQDTVFVSVRGTAWDSLRNAPLGGAFIGMVGSSRTAVSDARGRFRIDSVAAGTYTFTMQHDMLDSIGFSGRSTRAALDATHYAVTIAVPSFATLWRALCGGPPPKDSAIVYGVVRDVADRPVPAAEVGVSWKDVNYRRSTGFNWKDMGGRTVADSTGRYALCGVPADVGLSIAAAKDSLASSAVELSPTTLRISRRDLRIAPKGSDAETGTVTGMLTGKGGAPVAGAIVAIEGVPEVRSGDDGRFMLRDVPAGTRQLEARAIGSSPIAAIVDVAAHDTTTVALELGRVQTLDAIRVSAPTFGQVMVRNIEERTRLGLGYVRDSSEIGRLPNPIAVVDGIAGIKVCREQRWFVGSTDSCKAPRCKISVWMDRIELDYQAYYLMSPGDIALVEGFPPGAGRAVPDEFRSRGSACGAIVVWTKRFLRV